MGISIKFTFIVAAFLILTISLFVFNFGYNLNFIYEFQRLLPMLYTTQLKCHPDKEHCHTYEIPKKSHGRVNILGPIGPSCKTKLEKYGQGDGEKRACGLSQLARMGESMNNTNCIIYSIGSNNEWDFEEAIFSNTNCFVETFDCTVNATAKPPTSISSRVRLHRYCLGSKNKGDYRSLRGLHEITGIKTPLTFLKIDAEGAEFSAMRVMIDESYMLPLQIAMEIHLFGGNGHTGHVWAFINYMHQFDGYYLIDRNDNPKCQQCSEILLAKLDCATHPITENTYKVLRNQKKSFTKGINRRNYKVVE